MHYQGIIPGRPYPINRPLSDQDRAKRLYQRDRWDDAAPYSDLTVVRINSTYMEIVDKYYGWKGWAAFMLGLLTLVPLVFGFVFISIGVELLTEGEVEGFYFGIGASALLFMMAGVGWFLGRFEWAYYTHYPIRLNRKDRMVYVFRKDGTVLSAGWDELFFTLDPDAVWWEIRAHVLAEDGVTVKETFTLGAYSTLNSREGMRILYAHWEFFRRYMEEGPAAIAPYVKQVAPVEGKRESFRVGYEVLASNLRSDNPLLRVLYLLDWPLTALSSLTRWLVMRKGKIPFWPAEIEARNVVAADDPFCIDARINPPIFR
ncbi:DUF6708 domain-containing protein [Stenotrophomonas sp.]|uniref:DUF6708 domain-containing protein n=1 Tax=Stenotrophomonas sp. TaxID=69392 RepID=UPI0028A7BD73|nr:DUF6708 domain-containing protein [Stenotrophomonas sp.]